MEQKPDGILLCPECGAKNRMPFGKVPTAARCGKCGSALDEYYGEASSRDVFFFRCAECGTRNRIPSNKVPRDAKCGRCGSVIKTDELIIAQPLEITDHNFESKILKSPLPALLFAWAPWCPTCRATLPLINDFAKDSKGKVRVGKLNVDNNPMLSSKYSILSVPLIFVFDNGQLKEKMPGAMQKHDIMMKMAQYLK